MQRSYGVYGSLGVIEAIAHIVDTPQFYANRSNRLLDTVKLYEVVH